MGEIMIEVSNLTKRYGDHIAVNQLNFRVEKGQIYGFLGPNGAGKSTTMNMITGYLAPTEGTITIDGIDIMKDPEQAKKKIGYLPEIPPLYMDMTVGEYLNFVADMKKVPHSKRAEKVVDVMEKTEIKIDKVNIEKIIIMADGDIDGNHISALLLRMFVMYFPQMIEAGMVYKAIPPLYSIKVGNKNKSQPISASLIASFSTYPANIKLSSFV